MDRQEVYKLMQDWLVEVINKLPADKYDTLEKDLDRLWLHINHRDCRYIYIKIERLGGKVGFRIDMKGIVDDDFLGLRDGLLKRAWPYKFIPDIELTEKGFSISAAEVAEKIISAFELALTWSKKVIEAETKYDRQLRLLREQAHEEVFEQE